MLVMHCQINSQSTKGPVGYWAVQTVVGSVPTTPDPNTSEKVSRYKWEAYHIQLVVYIVLSAKRRA